MTSQPARKRLRASHACDNCRARKTRCDGSHPCETCCALQQECTFGLETNSRGKSDIILEGIQRIERAVNELNQNIATTSSERQIQLPPHRQSIDHTTPRRPPPPPFSASPATEHSSTGAAHHHTGTSLGEASNAFHDATDGFENAILESMHTSNTEAVLQWPHLNNFPSLRNDYIPVYELEQSREPLRAKSATVLPFVDPDDVDATLDAFERNVNFWYPTMSLDQLQTSREILNSSHDSEDTPETCLALLTMALGCASQVTQGLAAASAGTELDEEAEKRKRASRRRLGDLYFENALKRLYVAHTSVSSAATQCLFFVALYFAFQTRPLQAWEYISATSAKCLLLLAYSSDRDAAQDQERIRRIFWSCYILESDYVAELSSCPSSGIARVESSIPLPGSYQTHADSVAEEQSSLYFLACISMRRLLNRVHHLLYARDTGAARNQERFPYIVAELQHQLDDWRDVLPPSFAFSLDTEATVTETGGFLRQRYLTCRSVIYRPYLMWQLSRGPSGGGDLTALGPDALNNCKICLDSCLAHILNLKGFSHTVLVDTWICSLSMAGAMLVLLAACGVPTLRDLISEEILDAGDHLTTMLEGWQRLVGIPVSPSVSQSSWIIYAADKFIKEAYT